MCLIGVEIHMRAEKEQTPDLDLWEDFIFPVSGSNIDYI